MSLRAPSHVVWETESGASLGRGSRAVSVPSSTARLIAIDPITGGRSSVAVADEVDFAALPRGTVQARANPFADVTVGTKSLGTTPFPPIELVAGRYTLVFTYEGRSEKRVVEVKPGETTRIGVDFMAK